MRILDLGDQDLGFPWRQRSVAQVVKDFTVAIHRLPPVHELGADESFDVDDGGHGRIVELEERHVAVAARLGARTEGNDLDYDLLEAATSRIFSN